MNKLSKLIIASSLVLGAATGCTPTPDVKTGAKNNVAADKPTQQTNQQQATAQEQTTPEKRFYANFSKDFDGVQVNIAEIVIREDLIAVGLNFQNNKKQSIDWYPDQGQLVVGDMQLNVDPLADNKGLQVGTIAPGVKSMGALIFAPPNGQKIDINKVKELKLHLGEIIPEDLSSSTKVDITIPVPTK